MSVKKSKDKLPTDKQKKKGKISGGDVYLNDSRRHCQLGTRCPSWQYSCINITPKGRLQQNGIGPIFFERLEFLSDTNNKRYMILVTLTSCFSPLLFLFSCRVQRPNELVGKVSANLCVREPKADQSLSNDIPCHLLNHFRQIL